MTANTSRHNASLTMKRIDIHTHFAPPRFIEFAEKTEGRPFVLSDLYRQLPTLTDFTRRLDLLDRQQIDMHVLVPVPWLEGFPRISADPTLAATAARTLNDELAATIARAPTRFRGVAALPTVDTDAAVKELHRAVRELGFVGAVVAVGPTAKRMNHPGYEPIYQALTDLDVPLWLHPSRPPTVTDYVDEPLSLYDDWLTIGWPHDSTSAMFRIVFSGVFDRHPALKIIIHHHGGYVPWLAPRLASAWTLHEQVGHLMPTKVARPYIDHFRKFYCDTAASGFAPKALELAFEFFGQDRVLFGSDAPFDPTAGDNFTLETVQSIEAMAVPPAAREAIFLRNAKKLLKLP